jgi:dienelactone hydrolase
VTFEPATDLSEQAFELSVDGESVPGVLWSPAGGTGARPAVLIGHGRTMHKRSLLAVARRFVGRGLAAVALDAPGHGDRRAPDAGPESGWPRPDAEQVAREWRACVDFLAEAGHIDDTALGYWGVSMGTSLGVSVVADEPRVRVAVLGLMHAHWPTPPGERIRADAGRIACPVLFLANWHDQLVPVAEACELFDLIGSADKRLHAHPGGHGELPDEAFTASEEFVVRLLAATPAAVPPAG